MLTRSSAAATAAAAAAAAVVAAAASVASAVARGLDASKRAGRFTCLKATAYSIEVTAQSLVSAHRFQNGTSAGRARACVLRSETTTRAPSGVQASRCRGCTGGRSGDDRGDGSRGGSRGGRGS